MKKIYYVLILVVILLGAGLFYMYNRGGTFGPLSNFPTERGVAVPISESYDKDGAQIYSRQYQSNKTVDQNFAVFKKYLTDNGWKFSAPSQYPIRTFLATKGKFSLNVTIAPFDGSTEKSAVLIGLRVAK